FADRLRNVRRMFIEGVSVAVIRGLLDSLYHDDIIGDGEKELVTENTNVVRDQARCLIDMVIKKGNVASNKFIQALQEEDPTLCANLGLNP
uniref:CARD domain-containing protein n=1 Tax=Xenopus tropicalis TaxID=8364 RepID=A0A6I8SR22_XENTR